MTTIKATCPVCGDVELSPEDMTVTRAPAAGWATYSFDCPGCASRVCKPAEDAVVELLAGAGVTVRRVDVPAEALETHTGPALNFDDLIDFVLRLGVDDCLAAVALTEACA